MKNKIQVAMCAPLVIMSCTPNQKNEPKPNIIFILADDLGYGDLSCYGQEKFSTPNIDRLAKEGILFTQNYSGCTVSAPSRCSLMTGLHTGHTFIRGNKEVSPEGQLPLPADSYTIAEMVKTQGYTTGAFGKWGLGKPGSEGDPNFQGFDEFFGYNCQRLAHNYYPDHLWHNQEKVILSENEGANKGSYGPDLIHKAALKFMETNKDKPFFLFYASIIPHAELFAPEKYMEMFRGKFDPEKSFIGIDSGPQFRQGGYGSQPESHAAFAAMIHLLDDQVGELMVKLKELNLDKNTLIIFSSDNGPHKEGGGDPGYFNSNGGLRGFKRDMYEGGIRLPMLASWPGHIKPGVKSDHIAAFWDVMPTIADVTGIKTPSGIDGISFLPTLLGKKQKKHDYLYWEFHEQGGKIAIRMGDWKAVRNNIDKDPQGSTELYDLSSDRSETTDLASKHPEIVKKIEGLMKSSHTPSDFFKFSSETITK
ncbi:MAG: arylsulfatase [Bacteroidia bacterium]|nr:arylsulfatase [Bacteroidia bacterium]